MKTLSALLLAATLASTAAAASDGMYSSANDYPDAGAMAFDLVIVRPLGLVSTVLGLGLFVVQLPFDIAVEDGVRGPFRKLVAEPARFTFARPLGSDQ